MVPHHRTSEPQLRPASHQAGLPPGLGRLGSPETRRLGGLVRPPRKPGKDAARARALPEARLAKTLPGDSRDGLKAPGKPRGARLSLLSGAAGRALGPSGRDKRGAKERKGEEMCLLFVSR